MEQIAVQLAEPHRQAYWTNYAGANTISFANLDGSGGAGDLTITGTTVSEPMGIAIDPAAGKLYWANYGNNTIFSYANLDGTGAADITTTGADVTGGLMPALLDAPSGSGAPTVSGDTTTPSTLSCSQGSWAPDLVESFLYRAPQGFAYQWDLNGTAIAGATSATISASSPGSYVCDVTASNQAGSMTQSSAAFAIVASPPSISITAPANGATYAQGQVVAAGYSCADPDGPGDVASCSGPVASGAAIDTSTAGAHSFTVTAADKAGNKASKTVTYTVTPLPPPGPPAPHVSLKGKRFNGAQASPRRFV